ncbi:hypothetical protein [Sphingopyxis fribergensis]
MAMAICAALTGISSAHAQTQAQQDRLDVLARYTGAMAFCEKLGMHVVPDAGTRIGNLVEAEVRTWGGDQDALSRMAVGTVRRRTAMSKGDLESAAAGMKSDAELRSVRSIFLRYGELCLGASKDMSFSQIVSVPTDYSLDAAATRASDELLEAGGLASWQTPEIQARGDLLMLAGACRRQLGAARSDALLDNYGRSDDARERRYYLGAFDEGLGDTELNLDRTQCERALGRMQAKIKSASN